MLEIYFGIRNYYLKVQEYVHIYTDFFLVIHNFVIKEDQEKLVFEVCTKVPQTQRRKYFKRRHVYDYLMGMLIEILDFKLIYI